MYAMTYFTTSPTARRLCSAVLLALGWAALTGCATFGAPESVVKSRASAYWKARVDGRPDKAYEFTSPAHRQLRSFEQYRVKFAGLGAKSAEVASVTCEAERCVARVKLEAAPGLAMLNLSTVEMYMDDVWVLEDGQWWHYEAP